MKSNPRLFILMTIVVNIIVNTLIGLKNNSISRSFTWSIVSVTITIITVFSIHYFFKKKKKKKQEN